MSTNEMSKAEVVGHEEVIHTNFPVVAEGTGKTANNEGATEKAVYNVCQSSKIQDGDWDKLKDLKIN